MANTNPVLAAIAARSSIRNFTDEPVPREAVTEMLRAAMSAPSARNVQPWRFLVATDSDTRNRLADVLAYGQMLRACPLAVVVAADLERTEAGTPGLDYWKQDCAAATENLLLAVEALGYGAVWLGVTPVPDRILGVKRVLGLPETVTPFCVVAIGRPKVPGASKDKFNPAFIHWEKW